MRAARSAEVSFSPMPSNLAGTIRSTPYDLPPTCSSIHASSRSSCGGVYAVAPSTPNPPALVTAATTSRQWLNAKSGNSIPNCSQMAGFMSPVSPSDTGLRQEPRHRGEHLVAVDKLGVVVARPRHQDEPLGPGCRLVETLAQ